MATSSSRSGSINEDLQPPVTLKNNLTINVDEANEVEIEPSIPDKFEAVYTKIKECERLGKKEHYRC
jgi:hypothetical protein